LILRTEQVVTFFHFVIVPMLQRGNAVCAAPAATGRGGKSGSDHGFYNSGCRSFFVSFNMRGKPNQYQ